ncbi:hypothetical protein [Leptospira kanakyensis]|uniref:hypothetical protein n=1 Tax=Leptospira kanakyensis TaxID=2484968 RepID=UPI00223D386A|nr:hypothetical protein [Leptospira kanakyensis]MCW7468469.1 hypothetical protein [Leptospira kanakyensis]
MNVRLLFLLYFCWMIPLFSQVKRQEIKEEKPEITDDLYKLTLKKPDGPKFLTIYPGLQITTNNITMKTPYGSTASMTNDTSIGRNLRFFFDLKSPEWQTGKYVGFFLFNRNGKFQLTSQVIKRNEFSAAQEGEEQNSTYTASIGTEVSGSYSMVLPVMYFGEKGSDHFRIGLGYGISQVNIKGTSDFNNGQSLQNNTLIYLYGGSTLESRVDTIGRYSLLSTGNIDRDPYRAYLLSNLSTGKNLENLGLYSALQGEMTPKSFDPLVLYMFNSLTNGQLNPIELYALSTLLKGRVNTASKYAQTYYFFWEVPFGPINWRVGVGIIDYKQNHFDVQLRNFETALYVPIDL